MEFIELLTTSGSRKALHELQKQFAEARSSFLKIRSERLRLARSGWRPSVPSETRLIRSAEWLVEKAPGVGIPESRVFDLDSRFVPTLKNFRRFGNEVRGDEQCEVRIRRLELNEPRYAIDGRASCAAFFDLVLAIERNPRSRIFIPKVDGYLEARFWSDVLRSLEGAFGLKPHTIEALIGIETLGGLMEAEEILFELKEQAMGFQYDARGVLCDVLALESSSPSLPERVGSKEDFARLLGIAERRGATMDSRSKDGMEAIRFSPQIALEHLNFSFEFLKAWFSGQATYQDKDWKDLDLSRALVWTAIQSGYLREDFYDGWKAGLGALPLEVGSSDEAALRVLEPLLLTAVFPESSLLPAFSILLEIEKTQSVTSSLA